MKTLDEITRERPYLEKVLQLYNRLSGLEEVAEALCHEPIDEMKNYPRRWAEDVVGIIVEAFNLSDDVHSALVGLLTEPLIDLRRVPVENITLPIEGIGPSETETVLYLYSKAFLMAERKRLNLDGLFWQEGRCPVCSATPSVSIIEPQEKRIFYCNYCGCTGPFDRLRCPNCQKEYSEGLEIVMLEGQEGMRADLCPECKLYWKSFDSQLLKDYTHELLDLISLPMDIIIQDKGFHRTSPNPIGMRRMQEASGN